MNDLELWKLLTAPLVPIKQVLPHLEALASQPLWMKVPHIGFLAPLLTHKDATFRSAALRAMGGVQGYLGYRLLVSALDDPDTRAAAVEAIRVSVWDQCYPRWAHVIFHPDPAVRKHALDPTRPWPGTRQYLVYLLADPETRDAVLASIDRIGQDAPGIVLHLLDSGLITPMVARHCLARTVGAGW